MTAEAPDAPVSAITFDAAPKGVHWQVIHDLGEDQFAELAAKPYSMQLRRTFKLNEVRAQTYFGHASPSLL